MTEEQIEARAERRHDALDRVFMSGSIDEEEYRLRSNEITRWVNAEYKRAAREVGA